VPELPKFCGKPLETGENLDAGAKKPPVVDRGLNAVCSLSNEALDRWFELAFGFGSDQSHGRYAVVGLGLDAVYDCSDDPDAHAAQ
jgi:hypothetical protein